MDWPLSSRWLQPEPKAEHDTVAAVLAGEQGILSGRDSPIETEHGGHTHIQPVLMKSLADSDAHIDAAQIYGAWSDRRRGESITSPGRSKLEPGCSAKLVDTAHANRSYIEGIQVQ